VKTLTLVTVGLIGGLIAGFITGYFPVGPLVSFVVWGIMGVVLGFFVIDKKEALWAGAIYGFILTFIFMLLRFGGTMDKLPGYLLLTLAMSIAGIIGRTVAIFIGNFVKKSF
jgi:hypothetical protein